MERQRHDVSKTLDQLEGTQWGPPTFESHLVTTCHRLRTKPIGQFSVEDLRIMIGQQIGLAFLIPVSLGVLERDPLAEGDFYPGDLLSSVLRVDVEFWASEPELRDRLSRIVQSLPSVPKELEEEVSSFKAPGGPTKRCS